MGQAAYAPSASPRLGAGGTNRRRCILRKRPVRLEWSWVARWRDPRGVRSTQRDSNARPDADQVALDPRGIRLKGWVEGLEDPVALLRALDPNGRIERED